MNTVENDVHNQVRDVARRFTREKVCLLYTSDAADE